MMSAESSRVLASDPGYPSDNSDWWRQYDEEVQRQAAKPDTQEIAKQEAEWDRWVTEIGREFDESIKPQEKAMADVSNYFEGESKYLKAADLKGHEVRVVIDHTEEARFEDDKPPKLAVYFVGKEKGLALNKTNGRKIVDAYGRDDAAWKGKPLIIYPDKTEYKGNLVDCLSVRIPAAASAEDVGF